MLGALSRVLIAGVAGACLVVGMTVVRIGQQGERDERRPADAIVVLGAAQYDGRPSPVFAARLDHAVSLYLSGLAPYLVVTGGKLPGDRVTEAATARAWAIARGVPADAILSEDQGRTTIESMTGVAAILRDHGLHAAVFVSDRTHMLRVLRMATDQGIEAWGSPTATSPTDLDPDLRTRSTIHETLGLLAYFAGVERLVVDPGLAFAAPAP
jgi:uncharacterized SAM-binding protein YcdF (DUF218 family)